jgi:hypothetical protein
MRISAKNSYQAPDKIRLVFFVNNQTTMTCGIYARYPVWSCLAAAPNNVSYINQELTVDFEACLADFRKKVLRHIALQAIPSIRPSIWN